MYLKKVWEEVFVDKVHMAGRVMGPLTGPLMDHPMGANKNLHLAKITVSTTSVYAPFDKIKDDRMGFGKKVICKCKENSLGLFLCSHSHLSYFVGLFLYTNFFFKFHLVGLK